MPTRADLASSNFCIALYATGLMFFICVDTDPTRSATKPEGTVPLSRTSLYSFIAFDTSAVGISKVSVAFDKLSKALSGLIPNQQLLGFLL